MHHTEPCAGGSDVIVVSDSEPDRFAATDAVVNVILVKTLSKHCRLPCQISSEGRPMLRAGMMQGLAFVSHARGMSPLETVCTARLDYLADRVSWCCTASEVDCNS